MSGQTIEIKQTMDSSPVLTALGKEQQEVRRLRKELDTLKNSGTQAGAAVVGGAAAAGRQIASAVAQLTGIGSAIAAVHAIANQVRNEVANIRSRQSESGGKQIELGRVLGQLVGNMPQSNDPAKDAMRARQMVEQLARETGQKQARAGMALNAGMAGAGPETEEEVASTFEATKAALNTFGWASDDEVKLMTGAGIDLKKAFNFEDAVQSLGFLQKVGKIARIEDPKPLAENAGAALAKSAAFGSSSEEAGALFGMLTKRMVDKQGDLSATVFGRLEDQLRDRLPDVKGGTAGSIRKSMPNSLAAVSLVTKSSVRLH